MILETVLFVKYSSASIVGTLGLSRINERMVFICIIVTQHLTCIKLSVNLMYKFALWIQQTYFIILLHSRYFKSPLKKWFLFLQNSVCELFDFFLKPAEVNWNTCSSQYRVLLAVVQFMPPWKHGSWRILRKKIAISGKLR